MKDLNEGIKRPRSFSPQITLVNQYDSKNGKQLLYVSYSLIDHSESKRYEEITLSILF